MKIKINGKEKAVDKKKNIAELVSGEGFVPEHIVVEHNLRIVPKEEWSGVILSEDDSVEILSFVGGG